MNNLFSQAKDNVQFILVCILVTAVMIALARVSEKTILKDTIAKVSKTKYIALCGMLGALAAIMMLFEFPLIFLAPEFYKLDFSELPVMIGGLFMGPVGAIIIELIKVLLKLVMKGTSTAFVGDFANFIIGCSLVVPASIIYHRKKTKKNAIAALGVGTIVIAVFGSAFNAVYLLPAFASLYGMPLDAIIGMGSAINPNITSVTTLALFSVFPLNIIKGVMISVLTMLLYKHISKFLHNMMAQA